MSKISFTIFFLLAFCVAETSANCPRCEEIRRQNAANPGKQYFYYEDYLEDKKPEDSDKLKNNNQKSLNEDKGLRERPNKNTTF